MTPQSDKNQWWLSVSAWAILGSFIILLPIAIFIAITSYNRDKENMMKMLTEKGAALIRSCEAGTRTGMMHMGWESRHLQRLLEEIARQPGIVYLLVTDEKGQILADSDVNQIGGQHRPIPPSFSKNNSEAVSERMIAASDEESVFEVYRSFRPLAPRMHRRGRRHLRMEMMQPEANGDPDARFFPRHNQSFEDPVRFIFVGLDLAPLESAKSEAIRHSIFMAAIMILVGVAGLISLFLAQSYKTSQRSLAKVTLFSDEVVEKMPMGLAATDEYGQVIAYNETAADILGRTREQIINQPAQDALPKPLFVLTSKLDDAGSLFDEVVDLPLANGNFKPLSVSGTLLQDDHGNSWGKVLIFRDLTEVRRLEQEVERSRRLASVGSLAAGVAHEIRNPLSSIKGFATYFKDRYQDHPKDKETAAIMVGEVERLNRVISQLLEFARPDKLNLTSCNLANLVQRSLKLVESDAKLKGIDLTVRVESEFPEVMVDPDRLNQALLNLYINAIQAMEKGGGLAVIVSHDFDHKEFRIKVSDSGCGIDKENRERVFDPYYTTKSGGTGLGLPIVHKIMESHNGSVEIESIPGFGTEITLVLPDRRDGRNL